MSVIKACIGNATPYFGNTFLIKIIFEKRTPYTFLLRHQKETFWKPQAGWSKASRSVGMVSSKTVNHSSLFKFKQQAPKLREKKTKNNNICLTL